jgi:hypothetical protein
MDLATILKKIDSDKFNDSIKTRSTAIDLAIASKQAIQQ